MTKAAERVVLVTGASSGIGQACVDVLLAQGYKVCGADIKAGAGAHPSEHFFFQKTDIRDEQSCQAAVDAAVDRFGSLYGLVHMAGVHSSKTWRELEASDFTDIFATNVTGAFLMAKAAAAAMETRRAGAIVFATSNAFTVGGTGGNGRGGPAYVTSKAAIIGLMRALARSLGKDGIRVNAVAPGSTDTPMTANYDQAARNALAERTLAGRIASADEVAQVVAFLVSEAASYIFGEVVNVNGGGSFGL
jgi:3-oxoacyl-[acyl-carrier protein] reductase